MRPQFTWVLRSEQIELGRRTAVMGILNVTPDSFSDGGQYFDRAKAIERALRIQEDGADVLDIGGESSRPGGVPVSEDEELRRVVPVIDALGGKMRIPISIDTYRSRVAHEALQAGAQVINDISGFRFDAALAGVAREFRAGVVLMHSRGSRETLHTQAPMTSPMHEIIDGLKESTDRALQAGVLREAIVVDPGIGFGKRAEESLLVLKNVGALSHLQYPLLVGASRKSFIGRIGLDGPEGRLWGTAGAVAAAVLRGAHIVRVHDVPQMRTLVDAIDAIMEASEAR